MSQHGSFSELKVYRHCRRYRKEVSKLVKDHFPEKEKYLLTTQILNSSRSITANIAEGHGRYYYQDNIRFCRISRGSLEETLEHLITAFDENYISSELLIEMQTKYTSCLKLLNGYINYLRKSKRGKAEHEY